MIILVPLLLRVVACDYIISDGWNGRVLRCSSGSSVSCSTVAGTGTSGSDVRDPYHVEVHGEELVIADGNRDRILVCSLASPGDACETVNTGTFTLYYPEHATVDGDGSYVISDTGNHRVLLCTPSTGSCAMVAGTGTSGDELYELNTPNSVALDSVGDYVIADSRNQRVIRCSSASPTSGCEEMVTALTRPRHVVVLASGEYLIANHDASEVLLCPASTATPASTCTTVAGTGGKGSGPTQLEYPLAVAIDDDGDYVIADTMNDRIQVCSSTSLGAACTTVVGKDSNGDTVVTELNIPRGIAYVTNKSTNTSSTSSTTTTTTNTTSTSTTTTNTSSTSSTTTTTTNTTSTSTTTTNTSSTSSTTTTTNTSSTSSTTTTTTSTSITTTQTSSTTTNTTATSITTTQTSSTTTNTTSTSSTATNTNFTLTTTTNTSSSSTMSTTTTNMSSQSTVITTTLTIASPTTATNMSYVFTTAGSTGFRSISTTNTKSPITSTENVSSNLTTTLRTSSASTKTVDTRSTSTRTTQTSTSMTNRSTTYTEDVRNTSTPNFTTTRASSEWAEDAIEALLGDRTEQFLQIVSDVGVVDGGVVQELMVVAESLFMVAQNTTVAETAVRVLTVIGDIACDSLSVNEERTYTAPGGTELHVIVPSDSLVSNGFALGPVTMPALDEVLYRNVSVHVIVWATNLFHTQDVSGTMLTVNVRRDEKDVALVNLDPPLRFLHEAYDRITLVGTDSFDRTCVFWNTSSGNWSADGLQVVRANLTQVVCESTHATTFAVRFAHTICPFCTSAPVVFFDFEAEVTLGGATWIVLGLLTVLYCLFLHAKDRKDWIPVKYNWDAYYEPPRPPRRNRSMWARIERFLTRQMARRS